MDYKQKVKHVECELRAYFYVSILTHNMGAFKGNK